MSEFIRTLLQQRKHDRAGHEDLDYMSELDAALRRKPRWSEQLLLIAVAGLTAAFIAWACLSQTEQLTRGMGQVVPTSQLQMVQSLEGGILSEMLVREGDIVKRGQVLARVSNVAFSSEEKGIEARAASLRLKRARLQAEAEGRDFTPDAEITTSFPTLAANEKALYASRAAELSNSLSRLDDRIRQSDAATREISAQISRMTESAALLEKELTITTNMVRQKAAPQIDQIRLEREITDMRGNIEAARQKRQANDADLSATRRERSEKQNSFRTAALGELSAVEADLAGIGESLKTASDRVDRSELKSPLDGVVKKVGLNTIGGVVEPAMKLIEIVPLNDDLKITAKVAPADIAFLNVGQNVRIKITAYDSTRYGNLSGKLTRIGADTVTDNQGNMYFEIDAVADKNHLGDDATKMPITPGMVAQVDVITGKRSIMSYLLKPLLRARSEALTER